MPWKGKRGIELLLSYFSSFFFRFFLLVGSLERRCVWDRAMFWQRPLDEQMLSASCRGCRSVVVCHLDRGVTGGASSRLWLHWTGLAWMRFFHSIRALTHHGLPAYRESYVDMLRCFTLPGWLSRFRWLRLNGSQRPHVGPSALPSPCRPLHRSRLTGRGR